MTTAFEASILPEPAAISGLTERILEFLPAACVDARAAHHVALALEEILTNLATHGESSNASVTVRLAIEPDKVKVEIADTGPFFDLRSTPDPDLDTSIEDRAIGGLGLFLIRQIAGDIDYVRRDAINFTTFTIARNTI